MVTLNHAAGNPDINSYMLCKFCDVAGHTESHCQKKNMYSSSSTASTGSFAAMTTNTLAAPSLISEQYSQLIALLPYGNSVANLAGLEFEEVDW
ncbi:unnamed protein product [Prunus armeniaca]|uniref:Uncharacterized protein n=1 Tax=Prunus armeniaca TaxID=36596 RepID=A0A6J5WEW4_PRUAR|nr:unnamed protein product [Prunus armeniaca]